MTSSYSTERTREGKKKNQILPKFLASVGPHWLILPLLILFSLLFKQKLAAAAKSLQSCPTLCDPIDGSPPGSPVPGIL